MLTTRRRLMTAAMTAAWPAIAKASPEEIRHFAPSESATKDPEFVAFVSRLRDIAARKDAKSLLALMSPVFRVDFSFGKGPAAFSKRWKPTEAASELWPVLDRMLAIPAKRYDDTLYVVPYVYGGFPIDLDPLGHVVTTLDNVVVREKPEDGAKEIGAFGHQVLATAEKLKVPVRLDRQDWVKVIPASGTEGFVRSKDVYSPAEYRSFFEKQKGRWRWLSLVCAD